MKHLVQTCLTIWVMAMSPSVMSSESLELKIDHVMFPVYANNPFLEIIEAEWKKRHSGKVYSQPQNDFFKGVYLQSSSFYVEYLSNVESQPYWSNALYVVVPTEYWSHYENPAMKTEYFLVPYFGSGFQLVSPDYPHLNEKSSNNEIYDGLTILISSALENELLNIGGQKWVLPGNGKVQVHESLVHSHDIVVIDEKSRLVAPLYEANPILREYFK